MRRLVIAVERRRRPRIGLCAPEIPAVSIEFVYFSATYVPEANRG